MIYVVVRQSPFYHQMTLEEFLFGKDIPHRVLRKNETNTRTYEVERVSDRFSSLCDIGLMIKKLVDFNEKTKNLHEVDRKSLYREFYIPKKSGGLRKIDAPNSSLMVALTELKAIFEDNYDCLYHTSAFAYIKKRSTLDSIKRHQENQSKWFAKYDFSNFFGSTTPDFVYHMLSMIYPFSSIMEDEVGCEALKTALDLAFLDGGLPQGTPLSPMLTNVVMIPIDFQLAKIFRDFRCNDKQVRCVYTRYADDILISSKFDFDFRKVEDMIRDVLKYYNAPFVMKPEKTRYGSSSGSNWNLGVMLNKDNKITIGYRKKKIFSAMLSSYCMDRIKGNPWDIHDVQVFEGHRNYYRMVEGEDIDGLVKHVGEKYGIDIPKAIEEDLKAI